MNISVFANDVPVDDNIKLTIGTPFYNDDPSRFINSLVDSPFAKGTQLVVVDDGSKNETITNNVKQAILNWPGPAQLVAFHENMGRSKARNQALQQAKGEYMLFLDADVTPQFPDFLDKYFAIINKKAASVVYGGFITRGGNINEKTMLHHHVSEISDCVSASERQKMGAYTVASNNLMALREIFIKYDFNENFRGWGWEDTEWALRVENDGYGIIHIDNPVIHIGLDDDENLLRKYKEAGYNMTIMVQSVPIAKKFNAYRIANFVRYLPFHQQLRELSGKIALNEFKVFPIGFRRLALKYWRASWTAVSIVETENK